MMRQAFSILLLLLLLFSCTSNSNEDSLNGTWIPIEQEMGGIKLPESSFSEQKLTLTDNRYTMTAESVDKGEVTIKGNQIDVFGKEGPNEGKAFKAIYKIENEQLTICYNLNGDSYPEAFSTQGNPMFFMATFEKAN